MFSIIFDFLFLVAIALENILTEEAVRRVLAVDKGDKAELISWKVDNFTKDGDNYSSVVVGIKVNYSTGQEQSNVSYVAKLNPSRNAQQYEELDKDLFMKESNFFLKTLPILNQILESIGKPTLNLPRCFHSILEKGKEQNYFEDLREKGFQMFDRKRGMDVPHAMLILKELARLHASLSPCRR